MFYRRIVNLEDEDSLMAAPMPPQQRQPPQFGKPSFGPAPAGDLRKKRQHSHDSESENEGSCKECHRPKRSKRQGNNKRKAVDEAESESDEGDYRGLSRIALVSRRKRMKVSKKAFSDFWATEINGMSFAAYAQKYPSVPGSQSQDEMKPFWSRPEDGWKWPEKGTGELSALSPSVDSGVTLGDSKLTSPRQSEQNRPESGKNGHEEPRDDDPRVDSTSSSPTHEISTKMNDHGQNVEFNITTSSGPDRSKSEHDRESSNANHRSSDSDNRENEDKYVEPWPEYVDMWPAEGKASEVDARKHRIPRGYSLKNWDPAEEPILLLGSVFDANSLGKWIYDWTVYTHGPATPISEMAGEMWLLLIQLSGKIKRSEEMAPRIRPLEEREMLEDFIECGERLFDKLRKLLKICETPMIRAAKKVVSGTKAGQLGSKSGVKFVETIFGRERELDRTEKFMQAVRLWSLRFDANCEDILKRSEREAPSNEL